MAFNIEKFQQELDEAKSVLSTLPEAESASAKPPKDFLENPWLVILVSLLIIAGSINGCIFIISNRGW